MAVVNIENIKVANKNFIVSNLKTGDLIKTKAEFFPLLYHYGIIEKNPNNELFIIHNHPDKINSKGGNLIKEPLEKWIKGKELVSVEKTNLNIQDISELYETLKPYKYDFINFNCEHFVNFAKGNKYSSPQVIRYTAIAVIACAVIYLWRVKHK